MHTEGTPEHGVLLDARGRRRCNPHAFRHTLAVELWREDIREHAIQTQLGHARLDVTARYLRGLDPTEVLAPVRARTAPMMPVPHAKEPPT